MSTVLIIEDNEKNMKLARDVLQAKGYNTLEAVTGEEGVKLAKERKPDLILMDIQLPGISGIEAFKQIRGDANTRSIPVVALTASVTPTDRTAINAAGFDAFLGKPINLTELFARVRSLLRVKTLQDERLARLKSFFSPQLAEAIAAGKGEELLKTHRREITVEFFDLRGFTHFTETAEPEEVMHLLRAYHASLGKPVLEHEGTRERFAGDAVMVFFNDPVPIEKPAEHAVRTALAMHEAFVPIGRHWEKRGYELALGVGIAQGYATLGAIGFEGRWDYAAIGNVTNLAARLCGEAKAGQILLDRKTMAALDGAFDFETVGPLTLKGFSQPVPA